jgi:hypothetical protein
MTKKQAQKIANALARRIGASPPRVRVVHIKREGWSGRYYPKTGIVVVRYGQQRQCVSAKCPPDLRRSLLAHELAHWATRVKHCGEERSRARAAMGKRSTTGRRSKVKGRKKARTCPAYRGEHNSKFYAVLEKIHRWLGNPRASARALESRAGYRPPYGYMIKES